MVFYAQHPVFGFRIGPTFNTRDDCVAWARRVGMSVSDTPVPDSPLKKRYDEALVKLLENAHAAA